MGADLRRSPLRLAYRLRVDGEVAPSRSEETQLALRTAGELMGRRRLSDQARDLLARRLGRAPDWDEIESHALVLTRSLASSLSTCDEARQLTPLDQASLRYAEALMQQELARQALQALRAEDAPLHTALNGVERERVDTFIAARVAVGEWSPFFVALDKGLKSWERFSVSIADGGWMREEFENALDGRDHLHWFRELIISDVRKPLDERLNAADARYLDATIESERAQYARGKRDGGWQWWWWRKPKAGYE